MKDINLEQWRPVKGYENYAVSSLGRVKSVEKTCKSKCGSVRRVRERVLTPALRGRKGDEYFIVTLSKDGVEKVYGVHVLVALAFPEICGLPFEGAQCNHIDEVKTNNVPENLNWMTPAQNSNHGTRNERIAKALTNRSDQSKTVYHYTKDTHELVREWESVHEIERQMGWSNGNISQCCLGKRKTHQGFIWSYEPLSV